MFNRNVSAGSRCRPQWGLLLLLLWLVGGCSPSPDGTVVDRKPVHFGPGDECHVCGMAIQNFPGPKGQAIDGASGGDGSVRKFCSTRDLFTWLLQPENVHRDYAVYVHNMAQTDWQHPDDTMLIDAREAYYVIGSSRQGAMGPTLASFAERTDAESFASAHGGQVFAFGEITLKHLMMEADRSTPGHGMADNSGMPMHHGNADMPSTGQ